MGKGELELKGYKVLSGGTITAPIKVKASGFSKKAAEKIKQAGGEAIQL
jgi:ribosomal protein L15